MQPNVDPSHSPPWQIFLLGGLRLTHQSQPVPPPPYRSQALLARLLLHPTRWQREQLAGQFFPDSPESSAKARLSDRLWLLRNHLPDLPLVISATEIGMDLCQVWVDVVEFNLLVRKNDPDSLSQAVALYAGDLLPEQDDDWLLLEREHLRLLHVLALQTLAEQSFKSGDHPEALPRLEKIHHIEPFDENNLRRLMRCYQAMGQRGAALAAYERFQRMLEEEMDLEPEPATQELVQAVRVQTFPVSRSLPAAELPDPPTDLFQCGQQALWKGDFTTLQACAAALRRKPDEAFPGGADSLEAGWSILRGDFNTAARLLGGTTGEEPLCIKYRQIQLAAELRDYSSLVERCRAAILEAHRQKDLIAETLLLVEMGAACQRNGNALEAMRCANQVITLAEKNSLAYPLARGYHLKGNLQMSQGFERDALETLHHAAAHASEHGFLPLLARTECKLGVAYQNASKHRLAYQHYEKALQIARNLGMRSEEAEILQDLAIVDAARGEQNESLRHIRQGREIFGTLNDEHGMARNTYHLAFGLALIENPDLEEALALGKQALEIFQKHRSLGWVASSYGMLGYIHWLRGEPDPAIAACQQAIPIYQQLEESDFIPELYGYIGLAYLQKEDAHKALEFTSTAMDEMMRSELYDIASEIYYAHAAALAALGQEEEADEYFRRGYENLLTYAAEIEDPEARQAFFRRDPTVRRLMEQVLSRGLAPAPQVETHLVARRRSSPIPVALTVDAGAPDLALKNARGAVSLRRARLRRILREARTQGGAPTPEQIAGLMNVSLRTIQRDIRLLEEDGQLD